MDIDELSLDVGNDIFPDDSVCQPTSSQQKKAWDEETVKMQNEKHEPTINHEQKTEEERTVKKQKEKQELSEGELESSDDELVIDCKDTNNKETKKEHCAKPKYSSGEKVRQQETCEKRTVRQIWGIGKTLVDRKACQKLRNQKILAKKKVHQKRRSQKT